MKSRLCVMLALLAMLFPIAARANADIDLEALNLDQLYALREQVGARIAELESQGEAHAYESGTYHVGVDIPEGDYVLYEKEEAMFSSAVIRTGSTEEADLVAYHLINGQAVIRLEAGTWLTLTEASACPIAQAASALDESGRAGEGGYLVGTLLPPGTYTAAPDDRAPLSSYSIYGDVVGTGAQLLKFEVLHEAVEIVLQSGEYIVLSGCSLTQAE